MSDFTITRTKCLWREKEKTSMDCYQIYTWINHTLLMLLVQIFWKMSQISAYIKEKTSGSKTPEIEPSPLTKDSKVRRHIRSMSDVHTSTSYRIPYRSRRDSTQTLMYDSDNRVWKIRSIRRQMRIESSDSSDCDVNTRKRPSIGHHIIKHTDSMRLL